MKSCLHLFVLAEVFLACTLLSCSGSNDPAKPKPDPVETLVIEPNGATVPSNTRVTFRAVLFRDGKRVGPVNADSWRSTLPVVAQITAPGRVRGLQTGQSTIIATVGTLEAIAGVVVTAGEPARIAMTPKISTLLLGKSAQFATTSYDSIGNTIGEVTSGLTYTSSEPTRLSISSGGLALAKAVGPARLTANYLSFHDAIDLSVDPRQIELTITATGRDEWRPFSYIIYEPLTHVVERTVVVTFVDASDGNRKVYGGTVTIDGNLITWNGSEYTASVLGLTAPTFTVAGSGSSENYVEPFSVVTPLAPMLDINIAERSTYRVPGGELVTWTPFDASALVHFELYYWHYGGPGYYQFHYYNDWVSDSGSKGISLWEVPAHFETLFLDRILETPLSLAGYGDAKVSNRSTARRQVFTWK